MNVENYTGNCPETKERRAWRCRDCGGNCAGRRLPYCEACDAAALRDRERSRLRAFGQRHPWSPPAALVRAVCAAYNAPLPRAYDTYLHGGWMAQELGWGQAFESGAPMSSFVLDRAREGG